MLNWAMAAGLGAMAPKAKPARLALAHGRRGGGAKGADTRPTGIRRKAQAPRAKDLLSGERRGTDESEQASRSDGHAKRREVSERENLAPIIRTACECKLFSLRCDAMSPSQASPLPGRRPLDEAPPAAPVRLYPPVAVPARPAPPRRLTSAQLLDGATEVEIEHRGAMYRLRLTSLDKLILTK